MTSWQPTKGAWRGRNATGGFDFTPTLSSLTIEQADHEDLSVLSCDVVDASGTLEFANEDRVWYTFDRGDGAERIFAGHLREVVETSLAEPGPRIWRLVAQDYTAKLEDSVVTARRARKRERVRRRIRWIVRSLRFDVNLDLSDVPADEHIERYDYWTLTVRAALDHLADEKRLHFRVGFDEDEDGIPTLRVYRDDTDPAPFDLDNIAPDHATSFPFREFEHPTDSVELANAILVSPEKRRQAVWRKDTDSIAAYGRQERSVNDSAIHGRQQASNVGDRALAQSSTPERSGQLVCHEPGIRAGMLVTVREALWEHDETYYVDRVEMVPLDPHDGSGEALLKTLVHITKRRRRKHRSRDSANRQARRRAGLDADVNLYDLDRFNDRTIPPPSHIDGGATGISWVTQRAYGGWDGLPDTGSEVAYAYGGPIAQAGSYVGWTWLTYTDPTNPCSGTWPAWIGWREDEIVLVGTVPEHPANVAGILLTLSTSLRGSGSGVAAANGLDVRVASSAPTALRSGSLVGHLPTIPGSGTVFVPASAIPAAGQSIYVIVTAGWACDYLDPGYVCDYNLPARSGRGDSGRAGASLTSASWRTWASGDEGIGDAAGDADAPWGDASWTWVSAGEEGSPVVEVTSGCLRVTNGGAGFALLGPRENEDAEWGPWSDFDCAPEVRFRINEAGDVTEAGARNLEVRIVGQGEKAVARVHFGDGEHPAGISAKAPTDEVFTAKTIDANTLYRLLVDTRSGRYLRAKVWEHGTLEPTEWDVEVEIAETEDEADRLEVWARSEADSGTMEVAVCRIRVATFASPGERVVKQRIGYADGTTKSFPVPQLYERGTLRAYVDGFGVPPDQQTTAIRRVELDRKPARRAPIHLSYTAD